MFPRIAVNFALSTKLTLAVWASDRRATPVDDVSLRVKTIANLQGHGRSPDADNGHSDPRHQTSKTRRRSHVQGTENSVQRETRTTNSNRNSRRANLAGASLLIIKRQKLAKPRDTDGQIVGKWLKEDLTWQISAEENEVLTLDLLRKAMTKATETWAAVTPLTFDEVSDGADIVVSLNNGSSSAPHFIRPDVFAQTNYPHGEFGSSPTLIQFNVVNITWFYSETRVYMGEEPVSLVYAAIHEMGHALGLRHSFSPPEYQTAIMYGVEQNPPGIGQQTELGEDDIQRIQALYGPPNDDDDGTDDNTGNDDNGNENGDDYSNSENNNDDNSNVNQGDDDNKRK